MNESPEPFEYITDLDNRAQAQRFSAMLDEDAVPHRLASRSDSAYGSLFQLQNGWGYVEAPARYRETILSLLNDLRSAAE